MNLHEYQTKRLLIAYGVPVPAGGAASSVEQAVAIAAELNGPDWVVKAQVHAGGRGKAGGVVRADSIERLRAAAQALLGERLVTAQTSPLGLPVNTLLIESATAVTHEYYLALTIDRSRGRPVIVASRSGGVNIETQAKSAGAKLLQVSIDPDAGLYPYQCRRVAFELGMDSGLAPAFVRLLQNLYRLFNDKDALLIEINPLGVTSKGELFALDAKLAVDDNALFRHEALAQWRDSTQEDAVDVKARELGLNYVSIGGNIGCMVNGAGLAMATMDLIQLHGGAPANFLDVGGLATTEVVAEAFGLIRSDPKVSAVLVNIFGGIVRCDLIAGGLVRAVQGAGVEVPIVVRLEGTNVELARELLRESGLAIVSADDLDDAARKVVALSDGR